MRRHLRTAGVYPTTEANILKYHDPDDGRLSEDEGLRSVLNACDGLEAQVSGLRGPREGASAKVS